MERYILERAELRPTKQDYSYCRRAQAVTLLWHWKQIAICTAVAPLKKIAGKNARIVDKKTGAEVFRNAPNPLN